MKKYIFIIIVLVVGSAIGLTLLSRNSGDVVSGELDKAPDFSLSNEFGDVFSLSDFEGKVVVINSWATWCPFCVNELDDFAQLQKEFETRIQVIAVNRQESVEKSSEFISGLGLDGDMLFLLDPQDSFYRSIGGLSMPETIFVNEVGEIVFHKRGPMELEEMSQRVKEIINNFSA